jgi:cytochrome c553
MPPKSSPVVLSQPRFSRRVALQAAAAMLVVSLALAFTADAAESGSRDAEAIFESKVRPLLVAKCQECHGATIAEAGLRLDSRKALLLGSDTGAVVVPGDAGKSKLVAVVKHVDDLAMPPDTKLSDQEIATLEAWVAAGVPWTGPGGDDAGPASREEVMQDRLRESLASHWAFQPPARHPAPDLSAITSLDPAVAAAWTASPIDRFVAAGLAEANLAPAAEAAPRDLFRRLTGEQTQTILLDTTRPQWRAVFFVDESVSMRPASTRSRLPSAMSAWPPSPTAALSSVIFAWR